MFRRWLPQNLYLRVLLAMAVSITIVLAGVTALTITDSQARLKQDMLERGQNDAKILIHAASVYVAQRDAHQLTLTATAATESNQVQFVAFYDETGALLAAAAAPDAPATTRAPFGDLLQQARASANNVARWSLSRSSTRASPPGLWPCGSPPSDWRPISLASYCAA
jgi:hypothetical protein